MGFELSEKFRNFPLVNFGELVVPPPAPNAFNDQIKVTGIPNDNETVQTEILHLILLTNPTNL